MKTGMVGFFLLMFGFLLGGVAISKFPVHAQSDTQTTPMDAAALTAAVTQLKNSAPNQSHVMGDVAFMFSNVWFAGQKKNWPLANYYLSETEGRPALDGEDQSDAKGADGLGGHSGDFWTDRHERAANGEAGDSE
jgi:hypothetical protein